MAATATAHATGTAAARVMSSRTATPADIATVPATADADRGEAHCQPVANWASMATPKVRKTANAAHIVAAPVWICSAGGSSWLVSPAAVQRASSPLAMTL